jgi:alpha-D-ribose 1-methylphosphonate 5-triphosphate synthase subunit PhnH
MKEILYNEVSDAQIHFRILLNAMAHPGTIYAFQKMELTPPNNINLASVCIGFALLNADVSFAVQNENEVEITQYIALNTGASIATLDQTDYLFITGNAAPSCIESLKIGTLPYPENSATLIIDVNHLSSSPSENTLAIELSGPGIENTTTLYINGLSSTLLKTIQDQNTEFPLGLDIMLTDQNNQLACIPRSSKISFPSTLNSHS